MSTPSVTVCIPTYNYAHYLGGAIASVLGQSFADFELLIADDVSSDNTSEVVQPFLSDPRVSFMPNEVNSGMFANFNRCTEVAKGRYIKFLMADDWLARDFLSELVALLDAQPELAFATSAGWLIDEDGVVFGEQQQNFDAGPVIARSRVAEEAARGFNVIGMPTSTLMRTDALRAAGGFDADYAPAADIALYMKLLAGSDLGWTPRPLSYLRIHGNHTHVWGDGPDKVQFKVWRDAVQIPGSAVTASVERTAACNISVNFSVFAIKCALQRDFKNARRFALGLKGSVSVPRAVAEFLKAFPRILRERRAESRARREDRAVVYAPYSQVGEPMADLLAAADAGMSDELRKAIGGARA